MFYAVIELIEGAPAMANIKGLFLTRDEAQSFISDYKSDYPYGVTMLVQRVQLPSSFMEHYQVVCMDASTIPML
jgi:hypothetical protein